jgi:hypothetical protein
MARSQIAELQQVGGSTPTRQSTAVETVGDSVNGHFIDLSTTANFRALIVLNQATSTRTVRIRSGTSTTGQRSGDSFDKTYTVAAGTGGANPAVITVISSEYFKKEFLGAAPFVDVSGNLTALILVR